MEFFIVGLGGALGSLTRYYLGKIINSKKIFFFPIGTFVINITGAFLLGLLSSIPADKNIYITMGDGFLGAYTTFSTFIYEGFDLFKNKKTNAIVYISTSIILGLLGYFSAYCVFTNINI